MKALPVLYWLAVAAVLLLGLNQGLRDKGTAGGGAARPMQEKRETLPALEPDPAPVKVPKGFENIPGFRPPSR